MAKVRPLSGTQFYERERAYRDYRREKVLAEQTRNKSGENYKFVSSTSLFICFNNIMRFLKQNQIKYNVTNYSRRIRIYQTITIYDFNDSKFTKAISKIDEQSALLNEESLTFDLSGYTGTDESNERFVDEIRTIGEISIQTEAIEDVSNPLDPLSRSSSQTDTKGYVMRFLDEPALNPILFYTRNKPTVLKMQNELLKIYRQRNSLFLAKQWLLGESKYSKERSDLPAHAGRYLLEEIHAPKTDSQVG